jgi:PAS domain S-box-containing protein
MTDEFALKAGLFLAFSAIGLLLLTNPLGLIISATSFLLASLTIFLLLDLFPEFVKPLRFDVIPYYSYRLTYMPDPILGFRARPYLKSAFADYRGGSYSPLYGINVPPESGVWQSDGEGFRNPADISSADIAIIGSSFVEWGSNVEDTYPSLLEKRLGGQKVVNLGKAGYGPLQYIDIFNRYALEKKPRYVIVTLYPVGDTDEQLASWVNGQTDRIMAKYTVGQDRFFRRYAIAVDQTLDMLIGASWTALQLAFRNIAGTQAIHPDLALLKLPQGVTKRILFVDKHSTKPIDDLLRSAEWKAMEKILINFKHVCDEHQIVPLILYIPAATEVYAKYSTLDSGGNWLTVRESHIKSSDNNEEAARRLARKIGVELISLLPAYKEAAMQGKLVYYQTDPHWNEEGREIAAKVTADALKALRSDAPVLDAKHPKGSKKPAPLPPGTQQAVGDNQHAKLANDSIMRRALNGTIESWSHGAEQLYGWSKQEATGRVSHELLKTEFPEPLAKINSELDQTGRWSGRLVHMTRDGRRVVVDSRWILEAGQNHQAVVEINRASNALSIVSPDKQIGFSQGTVSR